jgi:hypothetical protein
MSRPNAGGANWKVTVWMLLEHPVNGRVEETKSCHCVALNIEHAITAARNHYRKKIKKGVQLHLIEVTSATLMSEVSAVRS